MDKTKIKVLITGTDGFIGKNLTLHLTTNKKIELVSFTRSDNQTDLLSKLAQVDFIFHLAGINRPENEHEFKTGNQELTLALCESLRTLNKKIPVVYTSSTQADSSNPYGRSKLAAEQILIEFSQQQQAPVLIYRLCNVFGKWAKPNYNSAVATFCYNISHDLPIQVHDPEALIQLVYVDDVVEEFSNLLFIEQKKKPVFRQVSPIYSLSVGELAEQIKAFYESRKSLITEAVATGLTGALYSTYISHLDPSQFSYPLVQHQDSRGNLILINPILMDAHYE